MAEQYSKSMKFSPTINLIQSCLSPHLSLSNFKVVDYPLNQVIFEYTFDELMEEVRGDELIDVGIRKVLGKWLGARLRRQKAKQVDTGPTVTSSTIPYCSHISLESYASLQA